MFLTFFGGVSFQGFSRDGKISDIFGGVAHPVFFVSPVCWWFRCSEGVFFSRMEHYHLPPPGIFFPFPRVFRLSGIAPDSVCTSQMVHVLPVFLFLFFLLFRMGFSMTLFYFFRKTKSVCLCLTLSFPTGDFWFASPFYSFFLAQQRVCPQSFWLYLFIYVSYGSTSTYYTYLRLLYVQH